MTLIEVMVASFITVIIAAASFTALVGTEKAVRANEQVVDTQQNVRTAMELLSHDIKHAGFGMIGAVGACTTAIVPADNTPAGADTGADSVTLLVPLTSKVTPTWTLTALAGNGLPIAAIQMNSTAVTEMTSAGMANGSILSIGGVASGQVANVAGGIINLQSNIPAPSTFPIGTQVYLLQCIRYQVGTTTAVCGGNAPCLLRGLAGGAMASIADGVEDLQLAYACDGCVAAINGGIPNGSPDDINANNSFDTGDFITNNTWATAPLTADKIRLVQINIVARQTAQDQGTGEAQRAMVATQGPVLISDHNPSADAGYNATTYSQFRRRVLTRTVETRNQGL